MTKLAWDDLLIEVIEPREWMKWFGLWSWAINGRVAPAFLNKFGSLFLRRADGQVEMLDVFSGTVAHLADRYEDFVTLVNQQEWQQTYLLSESVNSLHEAGKVPGPGQCYALAPHPALGGPNPANGDRLDPRFVLIMDIGVWQSLCVQSLRGV
jgi:Domain of unknown function (DUF1851)